MYQNKDGRVTHDDLRQALSNGGISVSEAQAKSIIGVVSRTGILGRQELAKLRMTHAYTDHTMA
jgi:Ca2+-binding EF-hand superfamily protein